MESSIFQTIGGSVSNAITAFITPGADTLSTALQTATLAFVTIYIMTMGFGIVLGNITTPISKFAVQALKIVVITSFVITTSVYGPLVIGGFESLEKLLASSINGADAASIYGVIDNTLGQGIALALTCFGNISEGFFGFSISWGVAGLLVLIGTVAIVVLGGASIIAAKLLLALLFALGPFFVLMLMFPLTAKYFDSWFSAVMNYTFVIVIISVIMSFSMVIFSTLVVAADPAGAGEQNPLLIGTEIFVTSFLMVFIMMQSYGMAASLAGGFSMSALTYAHVLTPSRTARNVIDPMTSRRDAQSGIQTTARRHEHLIAGNTQFNPVYRQSMRENVLKHWGKAKGGKVSE